MKIALVDRLLALHERHVRAALVTALGSGRQALVSADGVEGDLTLDRAALAAVRDAMAADRSGVIAMADGQAMVETWSAPLRLVVVGGVHIAQSLVPMAAASGFRPVVVDPRPAFGSPARFPDAAISNDWPDDAIARLSPENRTAVVVLTHDPKIDDPALVAALRSDAFYVGALGSRRSHEHRRGRLAESGVPPDAIARIRAPVGLPIGAATPSEIAVSILAEMIATLRGGRAAARAA